MVIPAGSGDLRDSAAYDWAGVVDRYNEPLPPPPAGLVLSFASGSLSQARHLATR
ncbi:non-specific serine/threonine protein kinase OS=Streptomyces fumanus OX=67302 GN=GCM10018772_02440 PE=3 SV=1 [Streptomyces fumanus]